MRMRTSFIVLAVAVGLSGCATTSTESEQGTTASSTGSQSTTSTVPGTRGSVDVTGSRTGTGSGSQAPVDLRRSVYYEFDKYDVKPEYRTLVESHVRWLRANPQARLTIEGNTDEWGSREYNVALGQRRAESVTKMMVLMGVKREQIEAISFGKEKPRDAGHNDAAWSENRRSDFAKR
jgi:peptidoglycan-associated lipoprotein